MVIKDLITELDCELLGSPEAEVTGISYDSRKVEGGSLFAAIPGEHVDGHAFIKNAVDAGATVVLAARRSDVTVPQIIVKDIRAALSKISDAFYGSPSKRMTVVGVTGTNGKTTTAYLLESVFKEAGVIPGVIGTINYRYNGKVFDAPNTTPQAPDLHRILKEMADSGVTHCAIEVSSHSLEQKRVADCAFSAGVFTNLTHDHLDYHKTMEEYFRCKSKLFKMLRDSAGISVINTDDEWGRVLKRDYPASITYSLKKGADVHPLEYSLLDGATEALVVTPAGLVEVSSHLAGEYNLQNILAAVSVAYGLGISPSDIGKGVNSLERVPGRLEKIEANGRKNFRAYVDYAHTGDALERALAALRRISSGRIITVFGCGGNRDRLKRPKMGEVSARLSNISIITSDNPRDEDPLEIIKEVEAGMKGVKRRSPEDTAVDNGYFVIPERTEAIRKAVAIAGDGDTILVAGKGHEDYQIVKGRKSHFNDFEELNAAIKEFCRADAV